MEIIDQLMPIVILTFGLTFLGIFTRYKVFLLLSVGFILFMGYTFATAELENGAIAIILVSLAGWMLFNIYLAFTSDDNA